MKTETIQSLAKASYHLKQVTRNLAKIDEEDFNKLFENEKFLKLFMLNEYSIEEIIREELPFW